MFRLRCQTPTAWLTAVEADFDAFLRDHAANERKAAASAMRLLVHHHDCDPLVDAMVALIEEEMHHFRRVLELLRRRNRPLGQDAPDPYMTQLHRAMHKEEKSEFLLDRLLVSAIVEARGCERFGILGTALANDELRAFYRELAAAEARHRGLFVALARELFAPPAVTGRLDTLLDVEAEIVASLPLRAALH